MGAAEALSSQQEDEESNDGTIGDISIDYTPSFQPITLFDTRERLKRGMENNYRHSANQTFDQIIERGEFDEKNPELVNIQIDEKTIPEWIDDYEELLKTTEAHLRGELLIAQRTGNKKEIKKAKKTLREAPLMQLAELAIRMEAARDERNRTQIQHRSASKKTRLSGNRRRAIRKEAEKAQKEDEDLKVLKKYLLKKLLSDHLKKPESKKLKKRTRDLVAVIQKERMALGLPPYNKDAITILTYNMTYRSYLWQAERRKGKEKTSRTTSATCQIEEEGDLYFETHCIQGAITAAENRFTSIPMIHAILGHDDVEDLLIHFTDITDELSPAKIRKEWLFCEELYLDEETLEDYEGVRRQHTQIARATTDSINVLTKKEKRKRRQDRDSETDEEKLQRSIRNLELFYEGSEKNGDAAIIKVCEQDHNFQTIGNLRPERIETKIDEMTLNWFPTSRNLMMMGLYHRAVGALVDHYHPELRGQFNQLQTQRIRERLSAVKPTMGTLLEILMTKKTQEEEEPQEDIKNLTEEFIDSMDKPEREIERRRVNIARRISAVYEPFQAEVVSIEFVPTPMEDQTYIPDIETVRATSPNQYEIIPDEEDMMGEFLILVKNQEDIEETIYNLINKIRANKGQEHLSFEKPKEGLPYKGVTLICHDSNLGYNIKIRVNTAQEEAISKRGVRADRQKKRTDLPKWYKRRISDAREFVRLGLMTMPEAVARIIGRRSIELISSTGQHRKIVTREGSSHWDAASEISKETFAHASHIDIQGIGLMSMVDTTIERSHLEIIKEELRELIPLHHLPFMEHPRTRGYMEDLHKNLDDHLPEGLTIKKYLDLLKAQTTQLIAGMQQKRLIENKIRGRRKKVAPNPEHRTETARLEAQLEQVNIGINEIGEIIHQLERIEKRAKMKQKKRCIMKAQTYIQELSEIFGISEEKLVVMIMKTFDRYPSEMAQQKSLQVPQRIDQAQLDLDIGRLESTEDYDIDDPLESAHQFALAQPPRTGIGDLIQATELHPDNSHVKEVVAVHTEERDRTLAEIGMAQLNPLKSIAQHIDLKQPILLKVEAIDEEGIFGALGSECSEFGINMGLETTRTKAVRIDRTGKATLNFLLSPPEGMIGYELLKFILKLHVKYPTWDVSIDPKVFTSNKQLRQEIELSETIQRCKNRRTREKDAEYDGSEE